MTEERKAFDKFRRNFKKQHGWPGLICARCGHFVKGGRFGLRGHMHHLNPLRFNGVNDVDNLIPLCHRCHDDIEELTQFGVTVEEFLAVPTNADFLIAARNCSVDPNIPFHELLDFVRKAGREMESVRYEEKREEDWPEYWDLWEEEKSVFPLLRNVEW